MKNHWVSEMDSSSNVMCGIWRNVFCFGAISITWTKENMFSKHRSFYSCVELFILLVPTSLTLFVCQSGKSVLLVEHEVFIELPGSIYWGTRWRIWLRHCATSRKVAGSIPDGVIGICHWHNPSCRTMALGLTQSLTEMSTRNISWG